MLKSVERQDKFWNFLTYFNSNDVSLWHYPLTYLAKLQRFVSYYFSNTLSHLNYVVFLKKNTYLLFTGMYLLKPMWLFLMPWRKPLQRIPLLMLPDGMLISLVLRLLTGCNSPRAKKTLHYTFLEVKFRFCNKAAKIWQNLPVD